MVFWWGCNWIYIMVPHCSVGAAPEALAWLKTSAAENFENWSMANRMHISSLCIAPQNPFEFLDLVLLFFFQRLPIRFWNHGVVLLPIVERGFLGFANEGSMFEWSAPKLRSFLVNSSEGRGNCRHHPSLRADDFATFSSTKTILPSTSTFKNWHFSVLVVETVGVSSRKCTGPRSFKLIVSLVSRD